MQLREAIKIQLARRGWELRRTTDAPLAKRTRFIDLLGIDLVIDVGANTGQYATGLREQGYSGRIVSFEPLPDAFYELSHAAESDSNWLVHNAALGGSAGSLEFNVSRDGVCSSPLAMTESLIEAIPQAQSVGTIEVPQIVLDEQQLDGERVLLKIDTQGYEHHVLDGASDTLHRAQLLDIEMALTGLYDGGSSVYDLLPRLRAQGFEVASIDSGFQSPRSFRTLDIDVLMVRA